jgi:RNA polymerase sigma-70 factor, ECF subfamily
VGGRSDDAMTDEPLTVAATTVEPFEDFYRREYGRIVALAYGLTGDRGMAEDLAQDAFSDSYRRWDRIGHYDAPWAWVRRAVINRSRSRFRHLGAEARALVRLRSERRDGTRVELPDDIEHFWASVRSLPKRQAQCVALRYVDDLGIDEIAALVGCAEATVRVHLHRARRTLAERLDLHYGEEDA